MGKSKNMDRRGSGMWFFVALAVLIFCAYSLAVAAVTAEDCGDLEREWQYIPPEWECHGRRGFG